VPEAVEVIRVPAPLSAGRIDARARLPARPPNGPIAALADRLWMHRASRIAQRVARRRPVDAILATAPPFMIPVLAAQLKRRLGAPLILDFRDDWVDTPIFDAKPAWQKFVQQRLERRSIGAADHVLTASEASLTHLLRRHADRAAKFRHLPNGWDPDDMPPPLPPDARSPQFIIASAGGYQRADRSPESLFRAVGQLIDRRPDMRARLRLSLVGAWLHRDFSAEELARWGVAEIVEEIPPLPKDGLMRHLQQAELLLVIPTAYWTRSIPGKLYEYGALARAPILLLDHPDSAPARFVRAHELGCAVARDDVAAIAAAVERYFEAWAAGTPARIAPGVLDAYSRRQLANQLEAVLLAAVSW
jgi:glycosyltransferase involved in cell wall biosynthesis